MKNGLHFLYNSTWSKYYKLRSRYDKNLRNGNFHELSIRKRQHIISKLKRLYNRLIQLKWQLKLGAAAGMISMSLLTSKPLNAQQLGPFVQNDIKNPFFRPNFNGNFLKPTFGDIDNDGDLDLLIGVNLGSLYFYRNVGTPTKPRFVRENTHPLEIIDNPNGYSAPEFVDIDGDGDLGLVVTDKNSTYSGGVYFHLNNDFENDGIIGNNPSFTNVTGATNPINGVSGSDSDLKSNFVDIDNDGDLDVFIGQDSGPSGGYASLLFFENNSGFSNPGLPSGLPSYFETASGYQNITPTFFDVDGDGDFDLFTGSATSQIRFFRNADIDLANNPTDLTIGNNIAFSEETGATNPFSDFNVPSGDGTITFMDIDNDGIDEALIGSQFGLDYFENDGSGNFTQVKDANNPFDLIDFGYNTSPTSMDIDGDGNLDIVIGNKYSSSNSNYAPSSLHLFRSLGDGTFEPVTGASNPFNLKIPTNYDETVPEFADIDNDGDMDLFVSAYSQSVFPYNSKVLFFRNSDIDLIGDPSDVIIGDDPVFTSEVSPIPIVENYLRIAHTLGDLDNDGDLDAIVGGDFTSYSFKFFSNSDFDDDNIIGNGANFTFQPIGDPPFNGNPLNPGYNVKPKPNFVDLDHDGDLEVVSGVTDSNSLSRGGTFVLFENVSGSLNEIAVANDPFLGIDLGDHSDPLFFDLDNDGDLDMFSGNGTGTIDFFENQNIPPQVNTNTTSATFTEGDIALVLDATLALSDDTNDNIIAADVKIQNFISGEDILSFTPQFGITGIFDNVSGILSLTGSAKLSEYEIVLQSVTYENTSIAPTSTTRNIEFSATDFDNTDPFSDAFAEPVLNISIVSINSLPVTASSIGTTSFTENDPAITIDSSITLSDIDNSTFDSATIRITTNFNQSEDALVFVTQNGISGTYDAVTGVLILSGTASIIDYQTALQSVKYINNSEAPSELTRTIEYSVFDGTDNSIASSKDVNVTAVNDLPLLQSSNSGNNIAYIQNEPKTIVDDLIDITDIDNTDLVSATITINGFQIGDSLLYVDNNGIIGSFNAGVLALSGTSSITNYISALKSIGFKTSVGNGTRLIDFVVNDGTDPSNTYSRTIDITSAAVITQPPVVNTSPATTQVGSVVTIDLCTIISDSDNTYDELSIVIVSILSDAITTITGCELKIDYSGLKFSGIDSIVLRATDPDGNSDENTLTVDVKGGQLKIYNAVSPNGDGANDWWEIENLTTPNKIQLFNRWGDLVKTLNDYANIVDNTSLNDLPSGTYFYKIESPQGEFTGYLIIKN